MPPMRRGTWRRAAILAGKRPSFLSALPPHCLPVLSASTLSTDIAFSCYEAQRAASQIGTAFITRDHFISTARDDHWAELVGSVRNVFVIATEFEACKKALFATVEARSSGRRFKTAGRANEGVLSRAFSSPASTWSPLLTVMLMDSCPISRPQVHASSCAVASRA